MNKNELKNIAENLIDTFKKAGEESIELFDKGLEIQIKKDNSPVRTINKKNFRINT